MSCGDPGSSVRTLVLCDQMLRSRPPRTAAADQEFVAVQSPWAHSMRCRRTGAGCALRSVQRGVTPPSDGEARAHTHVWGPKMSTCRHGLGKIRLARVDILLRLATQCLVCNGVACVDLSMGDGSIPTAARMAELRRDNPAGRRQKPSTRINARMCINDRSGDHREFSSLPANSRVFRLSVVRGQALRWSERAGAERGEERTHANRAEVSTRRHGLGSIRLARCRHFFIIRYVDTALVALDLWRVGSDQPVEMTRKCGEESACFPAGAHLQRVYLSTIYAVLQRPQCRKSGASEQNMIFGSKIQHFRYIPSRQLRGSMRGSRSVNIGPLSSSPGRSIPPVNDDRYAQYAGTLRRRQGSDPPSPSWRPAARPRFRCGRRCRTPSGLPPLCGTCVPAPSSPFHVAAAASLAS
jgi:hypothetical protein